MAANLPPRGSVVVRILHLEDSDLDADLICERLKDMGDSCEIDRVWTREDFDRALDGKTYDLILADHQLPAFDGEAALEIARVKAPDTPFIFVSGTLGEDIAVEALKRGATDYVVKQRLHRLPDVVDRALKAAAVHAEARAAEKALRESQATFASLIDTLPQLCFLADPSGQVTWRNTQWCEYVGLTPEQGKASGWEQALHPEEREDIIARWNVCVSTAEPFDMTFSLRDAGGVYRPFLTRAVPVRDEGGAIVRWIGTNTDISAQQEAENRIRQLNETLETRVVEAVAEREAMFTQLAELQKMETIGQLTGGVAHDFNNLLTPIVGNLDLLRRHIAGNEKGLRLINGAMQGADRAKTLVARLLAFARRQVLEPQAIDIAELVQGMTELIGRTIGPQIEVEVVAEGNLPAARVDPGQAELALLNLAVNARDAMAGGGHIKIHIDQAEVGQDNAQGLRHGRYIRLTVADTGTGMDPKTLKRAIEPFYSTKGVGKGTGLGLSMVHGLAAQSGGCLSLTSVVGEGTKATIWLPVSAGDADRKDAAATQELPKMPAAAILLVDDEDIVRSGTAEMLSDMGHRVTEAHSGAHALAIVENGYVPDLVITDYLMPGMTGAQFAAELRERYPDVPILLATGYANLAGDQMANLPLLSKPFKQLELAARLAMLLATPTTKRSSGRLRIV